MMRKLKHCFDIVVYLNHWLFGNLAALFSKIHGEVLMFHYITDEKVDTLPSCKHTPAFFERTLLRLAEEGYSFVSIRDMIRIIERREKAKFVVITFDDIMDDVYANAYPILKRMHIPFTLFVASGLVGRDHFVTEEHLKEMDRDDLCTIGAHTVTHCRLSEADNSKWEITESKQKLEELLGHQVDYFAYPYGWPCDVSKRNMRDTEAAGYKCAFGTIQSPVSDTSSKSRFYLPRKVVME